MDSAAREPEAYRPLHFRAGIGRCQRDTPDVNRRR
jgi:hypothetical protein